MNKDFGDSEYHINLRTYVERRILKLEYTIDYFKNKTQKYLVLQDNGGSMFDHNKYNAVLKDVNRLDLNDDRTWEYKIRNMKASFPYYWKTVKKLEDELKFWEQFKIANNLKVVF